MHLLFWMEMHSKPLQTIEDRIGEIRIRFG